MSPIKIMIVGDTHGYTKCMTSKLYEAGKHKIQHVLVVGDFGLWTHEAVGQEFLDEVQEAARINNLSVYAIGGNHENWDHWEWAIDNLPKAKGFAMIRRRILLAPKAHRWHWAGKTFYGAGGAVSIDKDWRLAMERGDKAWVDESGRPPRARGPRTMYWPNEQLTDEDISQLETWSKDEKADYLFTHDCSNYTPFYGRLKPDIDSELHRKKMDRVIAALEPRFHFHGHMHTKYDWQNSLSHGFYSPDEPGAISTQTYGLECNNDQFSWGILDTDNDGFVWGADLKDGVRVGQLI